MSGTLYLGIDGSEEFDSSKWNPLHCNICEEQYKDPVILQCYHSFCAKCIEERVSEGKVACPLCGNVTLIKDGNSLPPPDPLLKYLVESSTGETVTCANCDQASVEMFHCNTCGQSLCVPCREDTHRAKMFSKHDIVLHTKHTKDIRKDCKVHGEPYILFSTEKKVMLCINCFRDMKVESRSHCVDLETAYKQGCQKIDDTMQSIRDLQISVRDGILLLQALLEEIKINGEKEKQDVNDLFTEMQEKVKDTRESLLQEIDRQYAEKEELFKNQLISLKTFLPTLHVHLVTCAAFCSSTSKYEFLDFTYELMKRLTAIIQVQQPLHPSQTSEIVTDYKVKFAKCLEPLLFTHRSVSVPVSIATNGSSAARFETSSSSASTSRSSPCQTSPGQEQMNRTKMVQDKKKLKLKLMENNGFFSDHCKEFDKAHKELMGSVDGLKQAVQELQRDITLRRSLTKDLTVADMKAKIKQTEEMLDVHRTTFEGKQSALEQHWEEALEMIAAEQEVYQAQLQDIGRLKNEVASVRTIQQKLMSFMASIANVTQRLAPKLAKASSAAEHDSQHSALLQQISEMQPDSQQRVDAIRTAQEERDIKSANRVNPLDEELIKTKGLLRAPSARKDPAKRLSAEVKECKEPHENKEPKEIIGRKNEIEQNDNTRISTVAEESSSNSNMTILNNQANESQAVAKELKSHTNLEMEMPCMEASTLSENALPFKMESLSNETNAKMESINVIVSPDEEFEGQSSALPDIMTHTSKMESPEETKSSQECSEDSSSSIVNLAAESESDVDVSIDSTVSEESVPPGHVKNLIAKVGSFGKADRPVMEKVHSGSKSPILGERTASWSDKSPGATSGVDGRNVDVNFNIFLNNDTKTADAKREHTEVCTEYDRVNKFVSLDCNIDSQLPSADVSDQSPKEAGKDIDKYQASDDGDEVYVARSLPELAQVFEPGELKQKKRKK